METTTIDNFLGKKVKLLVKEPGSEKVTALRGVIESIDGNLIIFQSEWGKGAYNIQCIIAIKPLLSGVKND